MASLRKYRVWCSTDSKYEYKWQDASDADPTTCPVDPVGHSIDASKTAVVDSVHTQEVTQTFSEDKHRAKLDGVLIEVGPDSWGVENYPMTEDMHLNEAHVQWPGCSKGDYGYTAIIHPLSQGVLAASATAGGTQVDVGPSLIPYFNPSAGACAIEFWSADETDMLEVHKIGSVSGNNVIFDGTTLQADRDTSIKVKACFGAFRPVRGSKGLLGGLQFFPADGKFELRQEYSVTAVLPIGMILSSRVKTTSAVGTRIVTVNFLFRVPSE